MDYSTFDSLINDNRKKVYFSVFKTELEGVPEIPHQAYEFCTKLKEKNIQAYMPLEWREYNTIEKEIDSCDAMIVFIDKYWTSSTWKCSELTYALDGCGAFEINHNHTTIPTFLFPLDEDLSRFEKWTKNKPKILPKDVTNSVEILLEVLD